MIEFIQEHFNHVVPLLVVGLFGLVILIERISALYFRYPVSNQLYFFEKIRELILANRLSDAVSVCESYGRKPVARVVKEALLRAHQPEVLVEHGLELVVNEALQEVSSKTAYLATIANVATLMGLFGTIIGLIHSFEALGSANAQQKAALLAAGISTSMNATMLGLGVAIPCMIGFSFLMSRTNYLTKDIEQAAIRVLDFIHQRYYEAEAVLDSRRKV